MDNKKETWYEFHYGSYTIRVAKDTLMGTFTEEEARQINHQIGKKFDPSSEHSCLLEVLIGQNNNLIPTEIFIDQYGHVTHPPKTDRPKFERVN